MPTIEAFRGIRYDLGHVGTLSGVVAPPYDVIDAPMQTHLYQQHPANVVRLILNREEPGDDPVSGRYGRAARFLKRWLAEGVLFVEPDPAIYVYHQVFSDSGQQFTRRGFMARVRLETFGEGTIYPHEQTHKGPKEDRLRLMKATHANLSQVFGLYPDPERAVQGRLEEAILGQTPVEAADALGVVHRIWPVTDPSVIAGVAGLVGPRPAFVADGHHRYETACHYRDELAARPEGLDPQHPANFVLMMCVSMNDPGMIVLPTHRLLRGLPPIISATLIEKLGPMFTTHLAGEGADRAAAVWNEIERDGRQDTLGFFCQEDGRWVVARLTDAGRDRMVHVAPEKSADWRDLGVAILHRLVIETLLEQDQLERPEYVHLVDEVTEKLQSGDSDGQPFPLAALVMPATLDHVRKISEQGERMPAKSTYFYPKLLSGLVINPLK